jgi:nucleoside phosphorylase
MADTQHAPREAPSLRPEEYTVGWICATNIELRAAKAMLDVKHELVDSQHKHDDNVYQLGSINKHNVVIAVLPEYGTVNAAIAGKSMQSTFVNLRFGLLVGVGGGIPSEKNDIRLGDIAVSMPSGTEPGVIEYDKGKRTTGEFVRTGSLDKPPRLLLNATKTLKAESARTLGGEIMELVRGTFQDEDGEEDDDEEDPVFRYPAHLDDTLYENGYRALGIGGGDKIVQRKSRASRNPRIFYGNIGSGDSVIKSAEERNALAQDGDLICFEMEAAGLMNLFKCIVIRGICDYADIHKHKKWQPYAAAVAAAYAKKLLSTIGVGQVEKMVPIQSK